MLWQRRLRLYTRLGEVNELYCGLHTEHSLSKSDRWIYVITE